MKAIVQEGYGSPDLLRMTDMNKPVPGIGEVRLRVKAAALNAADWRTLKADPKFMRFISGFSRPRAAVPACDVSGIVDAVGPGVEQLSEGDAVFGLMPFSLRGGCGEYLCAPARIFTAVPESLSHADAAALPMAGITALQALRDYGKVTPGDGVLVNGASGGVGGFAVQLARIMGAEVTGVCSGRKIDTVRSLGASQVINYEEEDFSRTVGKYDVVLAVNGHNRLKDYRKVLRKGGRLVFVGGSSAGQLVSILVIAPLASLFFGRRILSMIGKDRTEDMAYLASLVENGSLSPMIERQYSLEQTAEAFRYVEQGHAGGKVLIVQ